MAITDQDIKLMASERLTDEPDGGGRMTGDEVVDGQVNNLFPDISRLDRVYGRVNLRKAFLFVDTANKDTYYGSHSIVDDAPDDPNVSIIMFDTGSHTDERQAARDRIESYVTQGPESTLLLLGDQLTGQRTITCYQREDADLPEIGDVYVLSVESGAQAGQQQYVRVRDVSHEVRTFTAVTNNGYLDFDARVVTLSLTTELRYDFPGTAAKRDFSAGDTIVRSTQVANAAKYYGIQPLEQPASNGDTQLKVPSPYSPLVPATQGETPQTDVDAGATTTQEVTSGTATVQVSDTAQTTFDYVQLQNRGLAWVKSLRPLPAPGTTKVEFRALGKWYAIKDRGDGKLEGDGAGTVDYATGSVSVTLGAQPDVGSLIIYTWGTPAHYEDRSGETQITPPEVVVRAAGRIKPGSVTVTWTEGGSARTATDDGAGGLTGDATGRVIYGAVEGFTGGHVLLRPATVPDSSTQYQLDYEEADNRRDTYAMSGITSSNTISFTLPNTPIRPGSVTLQVPMQRRKSTKDTVAVYDTIMVRVQDDGAGGLVFADDGTAVTGGAIDYSTGAVSLDPRQSYSYQTYDMVNA